MEPVEEDVPIDISDFPELVQTCFIVYSRLPDIWDFMGGNYAGKDLNIIFELLNLYDLKLEEEQLLALDFISIMDVTRTNLISEKAKVTKAASAKK